MKLTRKNYFSKAMAEKYFGASQFKDFLQCPAMAMAKINGKYSISSDALVQGSYLDAYFEGNIEKFKIEHPEMFKKDGTLLQKYERINECISVIKADSKMFDLCNGKQQKIFTGEIEGVPFKIMIDSLHNDRIVDRKCMADFKDKYVNGEFVPWWKAYGYDIQGAIYREIYRQNVKDIPFELVAISKESKPDKRWIRFSDQNFEETLDFIKSKVPEFNAIKTGLLPTTECKTCDWCKMNKKLTMYEEI